MGWGCRVTRPALSPSPALSTVSPLNSVEDETTVEDDLALPWPAAMPGLSPPFASSRGPPSSLHSRPPFTLLWFLSLGSVSCRVMLLGRAALGSCRTGQCCAVLTESPLTWMKILACWRLGSSLPGLRSYGWPAPATRQCDLDTNRPVCCNHPAPTWRVSPSPPLSGSRDSAQTLRRRESTSACCSPPAT